MKTRQNFLLALFAFSALFAVDAAAQRVKPTLPEPATIEAGKYYYLYNEDAGFFMEKDYSYGNSYDYYYMSPSVWSTTTYTFSKIESGDYAGTYTIRKNSGYYLNTWDGTVEGYSQSINNRSYYRLSQLTDGFYTIQRNYNYNEAQYIGYTEGQTRLRDDQTENIKWRLIAAEDGVSAARMMLYNALEKIDSTYCTTPYDNIFNTSTVEAELLEATKEVLTMESMTNQYVQQSWSDYKIAFLNDANYPWGWDANNNRYYIPQRLSGEKTRLTALIDVNVDDATLVYTAYCDASYDRQDYGDNYRLYDCNVIVDPNVLNVYIDGVLVRHVAVDEIANCSSGDYPFDTDGRYCERLTKGIHTIEWEYLRNPYDYNYQYSYISGVGVVNTPTVSVSLLEPGSLGTEILTQVNSVLDVRRLKIKGEMNADDWETINLVTKLYSLDLSEAVITEIPDNQFNNHSWLYEVVLPEGLARIGNYAFYDTYIDDINFPSTLKTIGEYAFQKSNISDAILAHTQLETIGQYAFSYCRYIKEVTLPESMNSIAHRAFEQNRQMRSLQLPRSIKSLGTYAFFHADSLRSKINYPEGLNYVPGHVFQFCINIDTIEISNSVKRIDMYAFDYCPTLEFVNLPDSLTSIDYFGLASCYSLKNIELPTTLAYIGDYGFAFTGLDSIRIPENISLAQYAFYDCNSLKYAELPTSYYNINNKYVFAECNNLNHIKIKSPTVLYGNTNEFVTWKGDVTVEVPDYLVNAYKLNTYWYTYKDIIGFGTSEVDTWTINNPVVLGATARLQGTPNVNINYTTLTMQGDMGMELQDLNMVLNTYNGNYYSSGTKYYYNKYSNSSQILTSADIDVKGTVALDYYTYGNHWAYISLPFDIKVSDIQTDAQYAIRYYDGTSRAATAKASGNWKNFPADTIITAGTGFIYQTSQDGWTTFVACDNTGKSRAFSAKDLSTPLKANPSETSAHRGWNLVGNPWMTWYNIHTVDFTAPITVYDQYNLRYVAYSIIDDDVALHPTEAFFVQCPDDIDEITFPARGRQLTSEIKNQNGAPSLKRMAAAANRQLIDICLTSGDVTDRTRLVLNDKATVDYDYGKDASKFFAEDNVMQLYTLGEQEICYSINERPENGEVIRLAYIAADRGEYTLSLSRNQAAAVVLTDLYTGVVTDLTQMDYTFTSDAGTFTNRFQLAAKASATGVDNIVSKTTISVVEGGIQATGHIEVYALDGRRVAEGDGFVALDKGVYMVRVNGMSTKVIVK